MLVRFRLIDFAGNRSGDVTYKYFISLEIGKYYNSSLTTSRTNDLSVIKTAIKNQAITEISELYGESVLLTDFVEF